GRLAHAPVRVAEPLDQVCDRLVVVERLDPLDGETAHLGIVVAEIFAHVRAIAFVVGHHHFIPRERATRTSSRCKYSRGSQTRASTRDANSEYPSSSSAASAFTTSPARTAASNFSGLYRITSETMMRARRCAFSISGLAAAGAGVAAARGLAG